MAEPSLPKTPSKGPVKGLDLVSWVKFRCVLGPSWQIYIVLYNERKMNKKKIGYRFKFRVREAWI